MNRSKPLSFAAKPLLLLALCICLIFGVMSQPVTDTVSYVTSLSATCVNTFTSDGQTEPGPSVPSGESGIPPTGDSSHAQWYAVGMLVALAGLAVVWKSGQKRKWNR
ncbi:MAG: hypothetical protein ACI39E_05300 [Acutalibacteraceae bacterium]